MAVSRRKASRSRLSNKDKKILTKPVHALTGSEIARRHTLEKRGHVPNPAPPARIEEPLWTHAFIQVEIRDGSRHLSVRCHEAEVQLPEDIVVWALARIPPDETESGCLIKLDADERIASLLRLLGEENPEDSPPFSAQLTP